MSETQIGLLGLPDGALALEEAPAPPPAVSGGSVTELGFLGLPTGSMEEGAAPPAVPVVGDGSVTELGFLGLPTGALFDTVVGGVSVTVTIPTASLVLTPIAPLMDEVRVIVPTASLLLSTFLPGIGNQQEIVIPAAALVLSTYAPSAVHPRFIVVPPASLVLTPRAPLMGLPINLANGPMIKLNGVFRDASFFRRTGGIFVPVTGFGITD